MSGGIDNAITGVGTIGVGVYLAAVLYRGNGKQLVTELTKETGFLEFLVAAFILAKLYQFPTTRPIVGLFILGAGLVSALNIISGTNTDLFAKYAHGDISLFSLAGDLLKGK